MSNIEAFKEMPGIAKGPALNHPGREGSRKTIQGCTDKDGDRERDGGTEEVYRHCSAGV